MSLLGLSYTHSVYSLGRQVQAMNSLRQDRHLEHPKIVVLQSTSRRIPAGIDSIVETKVAVVICTVLSETDDSIFELDPMNRCEAVR